MNNAVEFIKENVDIEQLLKHYDAKKIKQSGHYIRCCCPIHGGNDPTAFVFNKTNGLWFCHTGCQTGGDVFDLVMQIEQIDFIKSVNRIAEIFNIDISDMKIKIRTDKIMQDTKKWIESMHKLFDKENIAPYDIKQLGTLYSISSYRHFTKETLDYLDIKYCQHAEIPQKNGKLIVIKDKIVAPIYYESMLVGVTMRRTDNHPIKWIHQPEGIYTGNFLYNYDNIETSVNGSVIVSEGVWDIANFIQTGYTNAVATFGAHMTEKQETMLLKKTYNVMLAYDSDKAGKLCTNKIIERLKNKINLRIMDIPDGKDSGELIPIEMHKAVNNSLSIQEWRKQNGT